MPAHKNQPAQSKAGWLASLLVFGAAFLAYAPALNGGWVWDDDSWTTNIAHLMQDARGLLRMWTAPTALQQYYPLSGSTFWLDHQLWGSWTLPYHVENLLLHLLSAWLFWRLLVKLRLPGAGLAGALFALHPVMVESVAWITERKNVLSMALFLGSAFQYGRFRGFWDADLPSGDKRHWWMSLLLFVAAMLAKITAVALPPVLLLLAWWKTGRLRWREEILPVLPFFLPAVGLGLAVAELEKHHLGAIGPEWALSVPERCIIAGRALLFYPAKLLWPANLCFIYPRWQPDAGNALEWLFPLCALGTLAVAWLLRGKWGRGPATALFYYSGTLFPMLGFMNAYGMRFSFVADHWVYLSSLGILALVAGTVSHLATKLRAARLPFFVACVVLPSLAAVTWHESAQYRDIETLWRTTLTKNPQSWMSHHNLGVLLQARGQLTEAAACYQKVVELKPDHHETQLNYANILTETGHLEEALPHYTQSIKLKPVLESHTALARALMKLGRFKEAVAVLLDALKIDPSHAGSWVALGSAQLYSQQPEAAVTSFEKALALSPGQIEAHNNLGSALQQMGRTQEAISQYQKATALDPTFAAAQVNMGTAYASEGKFDQALSCYQAAARLQPDNTEARYNLGNVLRALGRSKEARAELETALAQQPGNVAVLNNLAWLLATCPDASVRDGGKALSLAQQADQLTGGKQPVILHTLAAAYAESAHFPQAVTTAEVALNTATRQGNSALVGALHEQLRHYRLGQPFRDLLGR